MEAQKRAEEEERKKEEEANKSQHEESTTPRPDESGMLAPSQPNLSVDKSQQKSSAMVNDKSAKSIVKDGSTSVIGGASAITTVPPGRDNIEGVFQPVILRIW